MARYRDRLPQLTADLMLADGGVETDVTFHHGIDLPHFAAFVLLDDEAGRRALREYYRPYVQIARDAGVGLVLETATWRANPDWGDLLGYGADDLERVNRCAVDLLVELRDSVGSRDSVGPCDSVELGTDAGPDAEPVVVSGCVGPRADGFDAVTAMTQDEAQRYHAPQIETFSASPADLVTAITMAYPSEAIGITRAAQAARVPVVISFTVETDGHLPDGSTLADAVLEVDRVTGQGPAYFMVNCAHPSHLRATFDPAAAAGGHDWTERIRGLRANASVRSHAELDEATDLDEGEPKAFGADYARLREELPRLTVLGGCCGTDHRHVREVARACLRARPAR